MQNDDRIKRVYIGKEYDEVMELPNLVDIQLKSYEKFLQRVTLQDGSPLSLQGIEEVFQTVFPIESPNGDMILEYTHYTLDEDNIKFTESECKQKGLTFAVPVKARINLIFQETGEIRQKDIYIGDIPLMTERGTFIINGAERVVVSQIHRSPGVIFSHEKGVYSSRIIPYRGSWLEFEIDQKKELIYAKIDRKKRILGTLFLRALGFSEKEKIIDIFYKTAMVKFSDSREEKEQLVGKVFAKAIYVGEGEEAKKLYSAGMKIHPHDVDELLHSDIHQVEVID
ncbi:MAG: DNA-directed RNA polymerase subunit beta, partial [Spirochaetales bacterium]|nr:DNA-directed RNA polymerase subunit beta [Spirochaetales bacterium]